MTTFYLIRHGVTEWLEQGRLHGVSESDLSERGRRMVELTAEAMRGVPLERIYSSPLRRCLQTAEPLARVSGTPITPCDGLMEMDFGWMEGKRDYFRHLRDKPLILYLYIKSRHLSGFLSGESQNKFKARVARTWEEIRADNTHGNVALVSHSGVLGQMLVSTFEGGNFTHGKKYRMQPASITELRVEDGRLELVRLNDNSHLKELAW